VEVYVDSRGVGETITEETPTERVVAWTLKRFAKQRMLITTSFGMEGCALIDMYAGHGVPLTVAYLDTMFFFPETYKLRDEIEKRYPHLTFVNRGTDLTPEEQAARYGDELWRRDPDLCCKLRKVDPMSEVMADVDVWITGLRRSQSNTRRNLRLVAWDWRYQVLKVSPLFGWERGQVWEYVKTRGVPYNELHEKGYPTLGCTHCTAPLPGSTPADYSRTGRWAYSEKTECGLHDGEGI
jgi:phosphoadenosine phosphosulfate reductase